MKSTRIDSLRMKILPNQYTMRVDSRLDFHIMALRIFKASHYTRLEDAKSVPT